MYSNILLSTDGSEVARKGVEHGLALAKAVNAKATVITVTELLPVDYGRGLAQARPKRRARALDFCAFHCDGVAWCRHRRY
jgi:nucleotide-binding universal stress UspA family protein